MVTGLLTVPADNVQFAGTAVRSKTVQGAQCLAALACRRSACVDYGHLGEQVRASLQGRRYFGRPDAALDGWPRPQTHVSWW